MKPTFLLNAERRLMSALVSACAPVYRSATNARMAVAEDIDLGDYGVIREGTQGRVTHFDTEDGTLMLTLDEPHPALRHWDNTLLLVPFLTDDAACKLKVV